MATQVTASLSSTCLQTYFSSLFLTPPPPVNPDPRRRRRGFSPALGWSPAAPGRLPAEVCGNDTARAVEIFLNFSLSRMQTRLTLAGKWSSSSGTINENRSSCSDEAQGWENNTQQHQHAGLTHTPILISSFRACKPLLAPTPPRLGGFLEVFPPRRLPATSKSPRGSAGAAAVLLLLPFLTKET